MSGAIGAVAALGGIPVLVDIVDATVNGTAVAPATATAAYTLNSSGARNGGTWLLLGTNSDYEARATLTSGTFTGGDGAGSWLGLGTTRQWFAQASNTIKTCTFTVEIRRASDGVVLDTATITLDAESTP